MWRITEDVGETVAFVTARNSGRCISRCRSAESTTASPRSRWLCGPTELPCRASAATRRGRSTTTRRSTGRFARRPTQCSTASTSTSSLGHCRAGLPRPGHAHPRRRSRDCGAVCGAGAAVPNRRGDTAAVVIDTEQHDIRRRRRGCAAPGARRGRHTNRRAPVRRVRSSSPRLLADDAPVTAYSRPADTQLMSWNRFPDTAVAAVSSALS